MTLLALSLVVLAVVILGVSKAGFGGAGTAVALPVMSLGMAPDMALAVLLPLLLATDVVSVAAHRKNMDMKAILFAVPGAVLGVLLGAAVIDLASPNLIAGIIGTLAILFALLGLTKHSPHVSHWPNWAGSVFGGISGLTSTLAHAGGPPIHIYLLARGYSPSVFVATSAGFMAVVNLLKIGPYFAIGLLDVRALGWAVMLAPVAIASAIGGIYLSRILSKKAFSFTVNWLLILTGMKLLYDAFS